VKKNIALLYGFSFFDQFMIVIALWVPYLATQGIGMRQFMELQAVFAIVILNGEVPSGLLSDLWGRKKTLLLGSTLKAVSFSLLPLWSSYEGFLFYHLGIALSMISGGDVALLYDSYLANGHPRKREARWQESGVALAWFGVLSAGYGLLFGFAGRSASLGAKRYGRRPLLAAVGVLPIVAYFGMLSALGILFSIAFVCLLLPLVLRETARNVKETSP
jgi:MFS family permease